MLNFTSASNKNVSISVYGTYWINEYHIKIYLDFYLKHMTCHVSSIDDHSRSRSDKNVTGLSELSVRFRPNKYHKITTKNATPTASRTLLSTCSETRPTLLCNLQTSLLCLIITSDARSANTIFPRSLASLLPCPTPYNGLPTTLASNLSNRPRRLCSIRSARILFCYWSQKITNSSWIWRLLEDMYRNRFDPLVFGDFDCTSMAGLLDMLPLCIGFIDIEYMVSMPGHTPLRHDILLMVEPLDKHEIKRSCKLVLRRLFDETDGALMLHLSQQSALNQQVRFFMIYTKRRK